MAISNNPFVPLIMQGVHMLAEDARQQRREFRAAEQYKQRVEEQRQYKEAQDIFNSTLAYVSGQSRNQDLTPESQQQFADIGFEMLKSGKAADLRGLQLGFKPEKPKEQKYPFSQELAERYNIPQGAEGTLGELIDVGKAYQDDLRLEREAQRREREAASGKTKEKDELTEVEKKINVVEEEMKGLADKYGDVKKGSEDRYNKLKTQHENLRNRRAELLNIDLGKITPADMTKKDVREKVRQILQEGRGIGNPEQVMKLKRADAEQYLNDNKLPVTEKNIEFYIQQTFGQ